MASLHDGTLSAFSMTVLPTQPEVNCLVKGFAAQPVSPAGPVLLAKHELLLHTQRGVPVKEAGQFVVR